MAEADGLEATKHGIDLRSKSGVMPGYYQMSFTLDQGCAATQPYQFSSAAVRGLTRPTLLAPMANT
jgi:hypothetical protein